MEVPTRKIFGKNFWIPFIIVSVISFIVYFLGKNLAYYLSFNILSNGNSQSYLEILSLMTITIPFALIMSSLPVYFIIRGLEKNNPKKVFYFELLILGVVYSLLGGLNQFIGLALGGPMDISLLQIFILLFLPSAFIFIWLFALTTSLYFYYKKKSLLNLHPIKTSNKKNISLNSFWIPILISSALSFAVLLFGGSFVSYLSENVIIGDIPYLQHLSFDFFTLIFTIIMATIPSFFIIKRLSSKNPRKVFYFELPILIIICSFFRNFFTFIAFLFGEFFGIPLLPVLIMLLSIPLFIIIWLFALTLSLYFYYKKKNFFRN